MLRKIWLVTRRRDPKSEAEIGRIAAESPVMKMPLRRRLAWAAAMLVMGSITTVAFALVFWPRDHAATLFSVGVTAGVYLPFVALVLAAPRRFNRWVVRSWYVSDEDARKPSVIP